MSKQAILDSINSSLAANKLASNSESTSFSNPLRLESSDLLQEYIKRQSANKAEVIESSPSNLAKDIASLLKKISAKKVLCNKDISEDMLLDELHSESKLAGANATFITYEKSVDSERDELFSIDTSIVRARTGVASLGIIGIASSPSSPRLSSLITQNCIVLLKKTDIVEHFFSGVEALKARGENGILPSNMIFIAVASRTADIELQTVFGVHGSLQTFVVLY